jgi:hypothetical protein
VTPSDRIKEIMIELMNTNVSCYIKGEMPTTEIEILAIMNFLDEQERSRRP